MKLITIKCPNCGAPLDADKERNDVIRCTHCRYDIFIERGEAELAPLKPLPKEPECRTPEELNDWNEFWSEILDNGDYYDIDEVENGKTQ